LGEFFASYPTEVLVAELQRMGQRPELDVDAEVAHGEGRASYGDVLIALHERGSPDVFAAASALCGAREPRDRVLGLELLRELGPHDERPRYPQIWELLDRLIEQETNLEVLRWVVSCLGFQHGEQAVARLVPFAVHPDQEIRATVAFHIAGCAEPMGQRVVDTQLVLARDEDAMVRGHAVYDFVETISADTPEVRATLAALLDDPDEDVRSYARQALAAREKNSAT
jgi:hypothetical protein